MPFSLLLAALFLTTGLLASASSLSVDKINICSLEDDDYLRVYQILQNEENPEEKLTDLLGDCRLELIRPLKRILEKLIVQRDHDLFRFFFDRLIVESRDRKMTRFFIDALLSNNMETCDFLLCQDFKLLSHYNCIWSFSIGNWELIKQLISSHPERAADIAPKPKAFVYCGDLERAFTMIDLARHAAVVNQDATFHATKWLAEVIRNRNLTDEDLTKVIEYLVELGAEVEQPTFQALYEYRDNYESIDRILHTFQDQQDVIKEPEGS